MKSLVFTNDNCVGCNKCIKACACMGANIADQYQGQNVIMVDEEKCIGCGACAKACPQQCITAGSPFAIDPVHCLQCGRCAEFCPAGAVERLHP